MIRIFKYSFYDLFRSRWSLFYFIFYLLITSGLLYLSGSESKVIITLMNVILVLNPLISTIFGIMYFYNSREFTELLLAQPVDRSKIFLGQYLGLSTSLALSFLLGVGLPFLLGGVLFSSEVLNFVVLLTVGLFLTFIFSAFSFWIALKFDHRIKGFGLAILFWLFMAIIYDGILLLLIVTFSDYPLEKFALITTVMNPIDLSRILILLQLDISALMGYTGAVFNKFFGSHLGLVVASMSLIFWWAMPVWGMLRTCRRKDF
ncbi:MAG: ABC transporter permease [Vicingaceae bacterium]